MPTKGKQGPPEKPGNGDAKKIQLTPEVFYRTWFDALETPDRDCWKAIAAEHFQVRYEAVEPWQRRQVKQTYFSLVYTTAYTEYFLKRVNLPRDPYVEA